MMFKLTIFLMFSVGAFAQIHTDKGGWKPALMPISRVSCEDIVKAIIPLEKKFVEQHKLEYRSPEVFFKLVDDIDIPNSIKSITEPLGLQRSHSCESEDVELLRAILDLYKVKKPGCPPLDLRKKKIDALERITNSR